MGERLEVRQPNMSCEPQLVTQPAELIPTRLDEEQIGRDLKLRLNYQAGDLSPAVMETRMMEFARWLFRNGRIFG